MTLPAVILLAIAGGSAVTDWVAVGTGRRSLELVTKPAVMVALIAAALLLDPVSESQRAWFVIALAASFAGDVALLVKGRRERRWFGVGLGFFLITHLAYVGGFLGVQRSAGALAVGAVVVWVTGSLEGSRVIRGAVRSSGWRLGAAVAVYFAVLSLMTALAAGTGQATATVGAVAFYVSDALLGWDRFLRPVPGGRLPRRITYHLGQVLLVLSLVV